MELVRVSHEMSLCVAPRETDVTTVLLMRVVWVQWSEVYPGTPHVMPDRTKLTTIAPPPAIASLLNKPGQAQGTANSFDVAADTVRGLASRNLSISVCLTGVILLQVSP